MRRNNVFNAYIFVFKQRVKRIKKLYQLAFSIIFDKVTTIYMLPFVIGGFFLLKESIQNHSELFILLYEHPYTFIIYFTTFFLLFYLLKGCLDPRYKVTSSDYNLHLLTYDIETIIKFIIIYQQLKRLIIFTILVVLFCFLGFFPIKTMWILICSFLISDIFTGIIQWKAFQKNVKGKIIHVLSTIFSISIFITIYQLFLRNFTIYVFYNCLIFMVILSILLFTRRLTQKINWSQVIRYGDDRTWNLLIVKLITGVGFNVSNRIRFPAWNQKNKLQSLSYDLQSIIFTSWKRHLLMNKSVPFNIVINCIAILLFLGLSTGIPTSISFSFSTVIAINLLYGLFKSRIESLQFKVLPVNVEDYINGYIKVTYWLILLLFFPYIILLFINSTLSIVYITPIVICKWLLSIYLFRTILKYCILDLLKVQKVSKARHFLIVLLYIFISSFIDYLPVLSLLIIVVYVIISIHSRKKLMLFYFR